LIREGTEPERVREMTGEPTGAGSSDFREVDQQPISSWRALKAESPVVSTMQGLRLGPLEARDASWNET